MRKIITEDAIKFLSENKFEGVSTVASMPDFSEFSTFTLDEWKKWFEEMALLIFNSTSDNGVSIFYQSDIKQDGIWIDKAFLIQKVAEQLNINLLWHKIICRVPAGNTTFGRPAYSHILCFSKNLKLDYGKSTPDVIPHVGEKVWERGMGVDACVMIANFLKEQVRPEIVINPFCGMGSFVSVAEAFDLEIIGIEKSPKRAKSSEAIKFNLQTKSWY